MLPWGTHDLPLAALLLACPDLVLTLLVLFKGTNAEILLVVVGGDALHLL